VVRASLLKPQNFALPPPLFRVHTNRAESFGRDSLDGLVKREVQRVTRRGGDDRVHRVIQ
jgi:hypothetical protein